MAAAHNQAAFLFMDHPPSPSSPHRPGDLILNRYMPDATEEEREAARENLREYAVIVVAIAKRLAKEESKRSQEILEELRSLMEFDSP